MATLSKSFSNNIVIQGDNTTKPAIFSNWSDGQVTYGSDWVELTIGKKGYRFSSNWAKSAAGKLTAVNGVDVTLFTPANIAALINSNVLTEDRFSGDPLIIADTTMRSGQFTGIEVLADAVLDVSSGSATVELKGDGTSVTMSGYAGATLTVGTIIYGKFSQIKLVSGKVKAYSNL